MFWKNKRFRPKMKEMRNRILQLKPRIQLETEKLQLFISITSIYREYLIRHCLIK